MTDELVKRLRSMHWCVTTETNGVGVSDRKVALEAADRIEALTAERDRAEDELYELQQTCITLRGENEALTAERDRLKAFVVSQGAQMQRQSEAAEVERDRLREALTDALAAWDDHNKHGDPMLGWWVHDARAALKGETP